MHSYTQRSSGFTLLEMLVTLSIIIIVVAVVLVNYTTFTSRSGLRIRAAEIAEFVRFAQERSASSELLDTSDTAELPTQGFQVARIQVRDGLLREFRIEKAAGAFHIFADASDSALADKANFEAAGDAAVPKSRVTTIPFQEEYFVDVCFINSDTTPMYTRKTLEVGSADCTTPNPSYLLCSEPNVADPEALIAVRDDNFDIHFSVEQPTREVHANILPLLNGSYQYTAVAPNGPDKRHSDVYEGVRIVLISPSGLKRSVDIYRTGLVSTKADNTADGCESLPRLSAFNAVISSNGTTANLSWDVPGDASVTYEYRLSASGGTFSPWSSLSTGISGSSVTATIQGLDEGSWYTIEVRSMSAGIPGPSSVYTTARSCSAVTDQQWTSGSYTCEADLPSASHGVELFRQDLDGQIHGSAYFVCNNGLWSQPHTAVCDESVVDGACSSPLEEDVCRSGTAISDPPGRPADTPSFRYWNCAGRHGGLTVECSLEFSSCPAVNSQSWTAANSNVCQAALTTAVHDSSQTLINTVSGRAGSAIYRCNNGTWEEQAVSSTCNLSCAADNSLSWTVGGRQCEGSLAASEHGAVPSVLEDQTGTSGSATFVCTNGDWIEQVASSTCYNACPDSTVERTWSDGDLACESSFLPSVIHGHTSSAVDTDGTVGSITYSCDNGTWSENPIASECHFEPIHGVCGQTNDTCESGTLGPAIDDTESLFLWSCVGDQGGNNSPTCWAYRPDSCDIPLNVQAGASVALPNGNTVHTAGFLSSCSFTLERGTIRSYRSLTFSLESSKQVTITGAPSSRLQHFLVLWDGDEESPSRDNAIADDLAITSNSSITQTLEAGSYMVRFAPLRPGVPSQTVTVTITVSDTD